MKKLLKVLAVALFALTPFVISSSASAQAVCDIGYTGPDSQNLCRSITRYACEVNNTNVVNIRNENNQVVASGSVETSSNGQGGSSTSGSVTNSNGTTFAVTITNTGIQETCVAVAVVPATQPPTPTTPVNTTPVQPTTRGHVAALPKTSGSVAQTVLYIVVGSLAAIAVLGVGSVALYRYYKSL